MWPSGRTGTVFCSSLGKTTRLGAHLALFSCAGAFVVCLPAAVWLHEQASSSAVGVIDELSAELDGRRTCLRAATSASSLEVSDAKPTSGRSSAA